MSRVLPFVTFQPGKGQSAAAAMELYRSVFPRSEVVIDQRHGPGGPAVEGTVALAEMVVLGQRIRFSDSFVDHEWDITPAVALWVELDGPDEQQRVFDRLADGGTVFMPLDDYGFGRFGWVADRHGVSWQVALAP